jgi:uncharacterized protein (DUF433 family)
MKKASTRGASAEEALVLLDLKRAARKAGDRSVFIAHVADLGKRHPRVAIIDTLKTELEHGADIPDVLAIIANRGSGIGLNQMLGRGARRRRRLQIEIRPAEEQTVARLIEGFGTNESDAGRQLLQIVGRLVDLVDRGLVITALPVSDEKAIDALPDLTRAIKGNVYQYRHLVELPHPWRRQLCLKGRRLTVSQVVDAMRANNWTVDQTADEFDISPAAVAEALDYASRNELLLMEEAAEQRRRAQMGATQRAATAG